MKNYTRMGEVLQKISQDHGENSLRNPQFLTAVFMDYVPMMKKEKELLRAFLLCNGAEKLLGVKNSPQQDQKYCFDSIVRDMADQYSVAENSAHYACAEFYWAVTNCEWPYVVTKIPDMDKASLDVRREITISSKERNTGKRISINVDQNTVDVLIPDNVTDGQIICFHGKGKKDSETKTAGDLYLTIHVQNTLIVRPWWIIAVTAILLVLVLLIPKAKTDPSGNNGQSVQNGIPEQTTQKQEMPKVEMQNQTEGKQETTHVHSWKAATYQTPKTCSVCGATEGYSLSYPWKQSVVSTTTGIIQVSPGGWTTYVLTSEGRVYAVGGDDYGQAAVEHWRDVVSISGGDCHVAALHSDGSVSAAGLSKHGQCKVGAWKNMVAVTAGVYCTVGICEDGTVRIAGEDPEFDYDVSDWKNIVQVDCSDHYIVGLVSDGTVRATGDLSMDACDVSDWSSITAIAVGADHTVGLKADGTVIATGNRSHGACDVFGWRNIVDICAGAGFTIGLCEDGTVVVAGEFSETHLPQNMRGSIRTPESWRDIIQISCIYHQIFGLTEDGYVQGCGYNKTGQCNVEGLHEQVLG